MPVVDFKKRAKKNQDLILLEKKQDRNFDTSPPINIKWSLDP